MPAVALATWKSDYHHDDFLSTVIGDVRFYEPSECGDESLEILHWTFGFLLMRGPGEYIGEQPMLDDAFGCSGAIDGNRCCQGCEAPTPQSIVVKIATSILEFALRSSLMSDVRTVDDVIRLLDCGSPSETGGIRRDRCDNSNLAQV